MSPWSDSESSASPSDVDPARSAKTTVTVLRTSWGVASGSSLAPQKPHSLNRSGFSSPQLGQTFTGPECTPRSAGNKVGRSMGPAASEAHPRPPSGGRGNAHHFLPRAREAPTPPPRDGHDGRGLVPVRTGTHPPRDDHDDGAWMRRGSASASPTTRCTSAAGIQR